MSESIDAHLSCISISCLVRDAHSISWKNTLELYIVLTSQMPRPLTPPLSLAKATHLDVVMVSEPVLNVVEELKDIELVEAGLQ